MLLTYSIGFVNLVLTLFVIMFFLIYRKKNTKNTIKIQEEVIKISSNVEILTNDYFNNIRAVLLKVLYEELTDVGNDTRAEQSLWSYFKHKISDIVNAYYELKDGGLNKIKERGVATHLVGSGTIELILQSPYFPKEFTNQIDLINKNNYEEFRNALFIELNINNTDDKISIIKTVTVELFRKNVKKILTAFLSTKHLIKEPDEPTFEKKTINKILLKETIALGNNKIKNVIDEIKETFLENEKIQTELTILAARLNDYEEQERMGKITETTEINSIRNALLKIIDNLN